MEKTGRLSLAQKIQTALDEKFQHAINIISDCAEKFGCKAYIIGGVVRDLLLEKPIYDIDIVIEGDAINFCQKGEKAGYWSIKRISEDFGTAKILLPNGLETDIASTRTETYPRKGHLPVIEKIGCPLKEDILRRDFTVNALALSLNKADFGEVIDYTTGLFDLEKKQLKILHDKSFIDDPTRIIRALRFKHKLNFTTEPKTYSLMRDYLDNFNENDIGYERIKQVLRLAFNLNSAELFDEFTEEKICKLLGNDLRLCSGKNIQAAIKTNFDKIDKNNIWLIYLSCLITSDYAEKLNLNSAEKEILTALEKLLNGKKLFKSDYEIYKFFEKVPTESIIAYIALKTSDEAQKYLDKLKGIKLSVNGKTLMALGFKEGKQIGETLEKILEAKINGKIMTKQDELNFAKKFL